MQTAGTDHKESYLRDVEARVAAYYDTQAPIIARWIARHRYYYARQQRILRHLLPFPGRVLDVGCGLGQNLAALTPESGTGIDCSARMIEEARAHYHGPAFPNLEFRHLSALDCGELGGHFDTIILVNSLTEIPDPVLLFKRLRSLCTPRTRLFQMSYNYLWEPVLKAGGMLGMCQRRPVQNWLSREDYYTMLRLAGFEIIRDGKDLLLPIGVPLVADAVNRFCSVLPLVHNACMMYYCVARPVHLPDERAQFSATVVVPCKNEEENIPGLVRRIPEMGRGTEIIFIDDRSTDGTADAVRREIDANPGRAVKLVTGPGRGKGAAVREGLASATGDVLMILDADLAVMPEALPDFMEALVTGKGEFINGSRLVYPMEGDAMRTLNIFGNKLFAILFSFLISQRIKDTLCGTKVIWRNDYPKILETREYFGGIDQWGDYDWLFGAARHNLQIIELPVHYQRRVAGHSKMTKRLRNAMVMMRMCTQAFRKLTII